MDNSMNAKLRSLGYRLANWGESYSNKATHAICTRHGVIVDIHADSHACLWLPLVDISQELVEVGEGME